ncbi:uncharacterized protein LOC122244159 [Penaeus japonicus]|uniref:uncharacterized protein LOC122244159 n=1 Tax=Penaeus japonicus TaxID=27405 RepID=UPI001C70DA80|nr:uncharacterized protein LOC122244159 [Penaeus japonicus]
MLLWRWWPVLLGGIVQLSSVAALDECGPWFSSSRAEEQVVDLNVKRNSYLWFKPLEDFAHITFLFDPKTIEPWSFVATNTSLLKNILLSQPTRRQAGRITGTLSTTTFGYDPIKKLNVTSNSSILWNVCTSPYIFAIPPQDDSSDAKTALWVVLIIILVVAVAEAGYIYFRATVDSGRAPPPAPADRRSTSSDAIYEEWNENWKHGGETKREIFPGS